jgi:hypothetical protein
MYGLLEIGLAASALVIDAGQVCEPKVTKARHARRHPKVDMRGGIFRGGDGTEVPSGSVTPPREAASAPCGAEEE